MPIVAVLGAGFALAMGGAAAIGGVLAGTATLLTTLEAVGAIGATLGAVGAVTHDKGLMTAGMVLGGIGGVGSLAASAGLLGAGATTELLFGSTAAASSAADADAIAITPNMYSGAAADVGNPAMQAATNTANSDIVNSLGGVKPDLGLPNIAGADQVAAASGQASALLPKVTDATTTTGMPQVAGLATPSPNTGLINGSAQAQVNAAEGLPPAIPGVAAPSAPTTGIPVDPNIEGVNVTPGNTAAQSPGILDSLKSFVTDDKSGMVKYGLIQAAGSLLGGATDTLKPAQVDALAAQAAQNRAATALSVTQQANLAAPIPVAKRAIRPAVTGAPAGIINSSPQTVTGAVA